MEKNASLSATAIYKLYNPLTNKLVIKSHVILNEWEAPKWREGDNAREGDIQKAKEFFKLDHETI